MAVEPDFDPARLERYLGGPVTLTPVASGQSNPTWFIAFGNQKLVLRKKPKGATLASAHAVDREYRVMAALAGLGVPVPRMLLLEEDPEIIGTPFFLMEQLEGQVCEDSALSGFEPKARSAIYADAARILSRLHRVDWKAAELEGFGKPTDYYARQVRRWTTQWQKSRTRQDLRIDALAEWFAGNIPPEEATTIVHGDYRVGNLMIAPDVPRIAGVLDWELSTLGDPRADLAHFSMFWLLNPQQLGGLSGLDLRKLGIPSQSEFLECYSRENGKVATLTPFHRAFALFRMSVIFEGITFRERSGQAVSEHAKTVGRLAPVCAELAESIISSDAGAKKARRKHGL